MSDWSWATATDSFFQHGDTWIRASRVEAITEKPKPNYTGWVVVTIHLRGGRDVTHTMRPGAAKQIARRVLGLEGNDS